MQIVFKDNTSLGNSFRFKDWIVKDLTSGVVYKFQWGLCNESYCGECVRHLNVRSDEHISISPLTEKEVKPKNSSVGDHLLFCNHSASYHHFKILTRENKRFLVELKESLLIMRDQQASNNEHYIDTIASIRQAQVIRSLLEFYLLLLIVTLFLLNGILLFCRCKCMSTMIRDNGTA